MIGLKEDLHRVELFDQKLASKGNMTFDNRNELLLKSKINMHLHNNIHPKHFLV